MRFVTPTDHPNNIAVFTAIDMAEAIRLADKAFRRDEIQGAIWHHNTAPILWDHEQSLTHHYRRALGHQDNITGRFDIVIDSQKTQIEKQRVNFGYSGRPIHDISVVDEDRLQNLSILTSRFDRARLSIRHEHSGELKPHLDGEGKEPVELNPDSLFNGQEVRILCSRSVAGTIIYDLQGHPITYVAAFEPWEVPIGDYLFLVGMDGKQNKALPHSTPFFKTEPHTIPRIVDVYDCRPRS